MATTAADDVQDIQRQMAQIRVHLHQDMQGVVAGAEAAANWRRYVTLYPWASLAAAFAAGFLVIPRKRRSISKTAEAAATAAVEKAAEASSFAARPIEKIKEKERRKSGLIGLAFGFLGPVALRAAQSYAAQYVENWILQQAAAGPFPQGGPTGPAGPPGRAR